jgi:hypothetical protein
MKKRNPVTVLLLSFITLGIYYLYRLYVTRQEMVKKGAKIPPFWIIFFSPVLLLFVAFSQILVHFIFQADSSFIKIVNVISVLFGIVALIGIPLLIYFLYKFCGGVEKITKGRMSRVMSFLLFIVLAILSGGISGGHSAILWISGGLIGSLWPAIIQNSLNQTKR